MLLSDSPQQDGKYSLSMSPSVGGSSSQPQLTLEPCHVSKKITNISQWVSAFNIFVSFNNYTPQLMKIARWSGIWLQSGEIGISKMNNFVT